jgi:alkaline phosphatase D
VAAPELSRRRFLGFAAGAGVALASARLTPGGVRLPARLRSQLGNQPFTLGVASGDPRPDRVVLWTRLAPDPLAPGGGVPAEAIPVRWEVARDERFARRVAHGVVQASPDAAHSVHVDARGLEPAHEYFYRFVADGTASPIGRTRTAPVPGSSGRVRFAVASCQHYEQGYYTAHQHLSEEDVDVVFWLGDYIYESSTAAPVRVHEGPEPVDLDGYRRRYATYKSDSQLQASHAAHPWITTWDDHEVDNNYAADRSQRDDQPVDAFLARRALAYRVWWEHQPVRLPPPSGPDYRIYRRLAFGDLATVHVLDTRQYRSDQPCGSPVDIGGPCAEQDAPEATLLGAAQRRWLFGGLRRSAARWDIVANQVVLAPVSFSPDPANPVFDLDSWGGYTVEQAQVIEALGALPRNGVVVTGDIHASMAADLVPPGDGADGRPVATELVGTSITSSFPLADVLDAAVPHQPAIRYADAHSRGYIRCELTPAELAADYRYVSTVDTPDATVRTGASFVVEDGRPGPRPR